MDHIRGMEQKTTRFRPANIKEIRHLSCVWGLNFDPPTHTNPLRYGGESRNWV